YAFSFVLVGDTQYITLQAPEKLPMIYDFIIDHREEKKIAFVRKNIMQKRMDWKNTDSYILQAFYEHWRKTANVIN
ncbi:MAG: hypothetical protein J6S21_01130, partial [Victivallales bacterium]|nr:hypothetical protein [Victivallales bacterium]